LTVVQYFHSFCKHGSKKQKQKKTDVTLIPEGVKLYYLLHQSNQKVGIFILTQFIPTDYSKPSANPDLFDENPYLVWVFQVKT